MSLARSTAGNSGRVVSLEMLTHYRAGSVQLFSECCSKSVGIVYAQLHVDAWLMFLLAGIFCAGGEIHIWVFAENLKQQLIGRNCTRGIWQFEH